MTFKSHSRWPSTM